jgi:exosortase
VSFSALYKLFIILCLVSAVAWWNVLYDTFRLAFRSDPYTHILLVLPVSAVLLALRLRDSAGRARLSLGAGTALLASAVLIGIVGLGWVRVDAASVVGMHWAIEMLALVVWWIGSFVLCFGTRLASACAFPLLFLLWLIPMPEIALHYVIASLQNDTAWLTREMFAVVGIPVTGSGTVVTVPGLSVEVAEECSSIRSSMILIVMATVIACLMLRTYWSRLIVILIAIPLAIAKNALRVFTLEALGAYVNPAVLNSPLHHQGGILFLAIAVAALLGIVYSMRRLEGRRSRQDTLANVSNLSITERL